MHKVQLPFRPLSPSAIVVDLDALAQNYNYLKSRIAPHTICSAVVKCDGYGIGLTMASGALQDAGCEHFFVASIDEALDLRSTLGPEPDIFVLSGIREGDEDYYISQNITPVLNSLPQVELWNQTAKVKQRPLPAILHFDTGMMRTGLKPDEFGKLGLTHVSNLELKFMMSHLACAYEAHNSMNQQQLELFDSWRRAYPIAPASLSNSGGIFLGERYHMDMVRPGLCLYGSALPTDAERLNLKPVVKVYAQVLQVGPLLKGHSVGYDGTYIAHRPSRIATLGIGYGDGYLRNLSNKGQIYLGGYRVSVIGRVSMDLLTVDITDLPEDACHVGDWAEVMGDHIHIDDVAKIADAAPWELLTSLSTRSHRYYKPYEINKIKKEAS